ncbi:MAG: hypothetical protein RIR70_1116 [Pseudomonadota bacterium]
MLLLDKPLGLSSNHALQAAKRLLWAEKAGHTGTLDPLATGLLPLCFGEATKFSQTLLDADKAYDATLKLGVRTQTFDAEGEVVSQCPVDVSEPQLLAALAPFRGAIEQVPPMHSALKVAGRALYEYAREGVVLERAPRKVVIHSLEVIEFAGDVARIRVACSKGTYIRSLAEDIGLALGCGAHLSALRRTRIGPFDLSGAVTLAALEGCPADQRDGLLAPADALLASLPCYALSSSESLAIRQGQRVPVQLSEGDYRLFEGERFIGLGRVAAGLLHPQRLVRESQPA